MVKSSPPSRLSRRMAFVVLAAGSVAAWILVVVLVLLATQSSDSPTPTDAIAERPTLVFLTGTPRPTATITPTTTPTNTATSTPSPTFTPAPTEVPPPVPTLSPAAVAAALPASPCAPPSDWQRYEVQPDDTLFAFQLGADNAVTVDQIVAANCLTSRYLQVGQVLYLPPGAAENAPPSYPAAVQQSSGPRVPACPCTITIQIGWRREQVADAINAAKTAFSGADFLAATGPGVSVPYDFVGGGRSMEGFLFPGTYTVMNETTAEQFRDMLLSAFDANVPANLRADAAAQGISFYEVMIIASIVQRESRDPEAQKLVASVYYNRLRSGNRLGSSVPLQYALGGPGNWWPRIGAGSLNLDNPYNTLNRPGLPPSPIDSPGLSAIVASIYPAQTNYLFHTASCNGTGEVFAATYEEHLANVNCE